MSETNNIRREALAWWRKSNFSEIELQKWQSILATGSPFKGWTFPMVNASSSAIEYFYRLDKNYTTTH